MSEPIEFTLQLTPMPDHVIGGFRVTWLEGGDDEGNVKFDLCAGAGMGNPGLYLTVQVGEKSYRYSCSVADATMAAVHEVVARHEREAGNG